MRKFEVHFAEFIQRICILHKRVQTESPYRKDMEISMRLKFLKLYLHEQYEGFVKPGFNNDMKRGNSLRILRRCTASDIRECTLKIFTWESIRYNSSIRQLNKSLETL
jgi:hypothetical protein